MPDIMTAAAVLSVALRCGLGVEPSLIDAIAQRESGRNRLAITRNHNGTTDYGLMQINSSNFEWLGLTPKTAMDACQNVKAAAVVIQSLSAYNTGSKLKGVKYATEVLELKRVSKPIRQNAAKQPRRFVVSSPAASKRSGD